MVCGHIPPVSASVFMWLFSLCVPLLIRMQGIGFRATLIQHDLILTNYISKHPISKKGHILRFQVDVNLGGCYPTLYLAQALAPRSGVKELLVGAPWGQVGHYMPHAQVTKPSWFGGIFGILAMKGSGPRRPGYIGVLGHPTLCLNNGGGWMPEKPHNGRWPPSGSHLTQVMYLGLHPLSSPRGGSDWLMLGQSEMAGKSHGTDLVAGGLFSEDGEAPGVNSSPQGASASSRP